MCNTYRITPKKKSAKGLRGRVSEAAGKLGRTLVRKSDPGLVVLEGERVMSMRWGVHRSFNTCINNARAENLESEMWRGAFRERRCIIPASAFYEWGPGPGGHRRAHEFRDPLGDYLWIAGVWEENAEVGLCYSMITTAAPPPMAPIHNRMPAVLRAEEIAEYLTGPPTLSLRPFTGELLVEPCESPLGKPQSGSDQLMLFE